MVYKIESFSGKELITLIFLTILFIYGIYIYYKNNYLIKKSKPRNKRQNYDEYKEQIREIFQEEKTRDEWKKELLNMVLGNQAVASRLIDAERTMRPKLTEKDLIRLAVERLRRDQR